MASAIGQIAKMAARAAVKRKAKSAAVKKAANKAARKDAAAKTPKKAQATKSGLYPKGPGPLTRQGTKRRRVVRDKTEAGKKTDNSWQTRQDISRNKDADKYTAKKAASKPKSAARKDQSKPTKTGGGRRGASKKK